MTTCAIMQPTYLPWLGYFDLIRQSDVFVLLDHVQFSRQSWQQRNRIRNRQGEVLLTVPVKRNGKKPLALNCAEIADSTIIVNKHWRTISQNYAACDSASDVLEKLGNVYTSPWQYLALLNIRLIELGCQLMNITTTIVKSTTLGVQGERVDALIDICEKLNANSYLSTPGASNYINDEAIEKFGNSGIDFSYHEFEHPVYQQCNYPDFVSHLAFIDYLLNTYDHGSH
ncbi:MAG: WbqC family protein [Pseudomonadota bacterium]